MKPQSISANKNGEQNEVKGKGPTTRPKAKKTAEKKLDEAIEMSFPASDPIAIIQPSEHKASGTKADSRAKNSDDPVPDR
ncbi:MAG: hypothetical protein K0R08_1435 [Solimicrobium sp.]|jgi:hypothetical protein|nr:hypothetical protein [Solimicrobium sp.]